MHFRPNRKPGLILVVKWSDPCLRVWIETQKGSRNLFFAFCEFFDSAFLRSPPRDRARLRLSEKLLLVPQQSKLRPGHHFEGKRTLLQSFFSMSDLDGGLPVTFRPPNKSGGGFFSNFPGLGFFFRGLRPTGRPSSRFWSLVLFF